MKPQIMSIAIMLICLFAALGTGFRPEPPRLDIIVYGFATGLALAAHRYWQREKQTLLSEEVAKTPSQLNSFERTHRRIVLVVYAVAMAFLLQEEEPLATGLVLTFIFASQASYRLVGLLHTPRS